MQNHPLTPMTDSNLVRVLQRQSQAQGGLDPARRRARGDGRNPAGIRKARSGGAAIAIVDATSDDDLTAIGAACYDLPLVTGGSGIAMGLPANFRAQGLLAEERGRGELPRSGGAGTP